MLSKLPFLLKQSAWLLALLIITSALPARAQEEDPDVYMQEGQFIFEYSDDLKGYIISPNKYSGWSWDKSDLTFLEVPSTRLMDGKPVVGLSGFHSLKYLEQIIFPEDCYVKYICDECFQYCTSLGTTEELTLPETVETIGHYAFYDCTSLQSIKLSSNLKSIGRSAFEKCANLQSITLPKSLKVIRENAFRNCANFDNWGNFTGGGLQSVVFEDEVDFYNTNGFYGFYGYVFWGCANLSSVKLPNNTPGDFVIPLGTFGYCGKLKSIVFPENTRNIEGMAFYRSGLESLDLTKIKCEPFYLSGYYTFAACENLTTITAKGKVEFTGLYTFQDCKKLETATFTSSGGDDDYTVMNPDIFKYCDNLKSVEFYRLKGNGQPNDMDSVFTGCKKLERVISTRTPEISKIGYSCFDGCEKLTTLSLPETEFLINETAFRNCTDLESFDFSNVKSIGKASFANCVALTTTPNISNVSTIGERAFEGCTGLTSLDFENLTSIGTAAFNGCTALASINFNYSSETPAPPTITASIGSQAFNGCTALASLNFNYSSETPAPPTITASIGSQAFTGCTALASINFNSSSYVPPTVESEDAFDAEHYTTTKVNMPEDRYRDFADNAIWQKFYNLKRPMYAYTPVPGGYSIRKSDYALEEDFTNIEIPATYNSQDVVAIEEGAFQGLLFLYSVTLHEKIASIGANAFADCITLSKVINKRTEPLTGDDCPDTAFGSDAYLGTLIVPFGSLDAYSNTAPWSNFSVKKQGIGDLYLPDPTASPESGDFSRSFDLTLTKPNGVRGTIYYYVVSEGDDETAVHPTFPFTDPITIPTKSSKVWAYISLETDDVTYRSDPVSFNYNYVPFVTEVGLDKVLSALDGDKVVINTNLYGHYHDGNYLYASTMGNSGSSKNTFNEDKKSTDGSDNENKFNQEDWVAISGLTSDFVGQEIESGYTATIVSNTDYPVISFQESVQSANGSMGSNTFFVRNFNIHAENSEVSNIWLVAPQPAEYCTVAGFTDSENIHHEDGYLILRSAESETISENETIIQPLSLKVYYDPATIILDDNGEYTFAGIVKREGDGLAFTVVKILNSPYMASIEDVDADEPHIFAANGKINVAANAITSITVFSTTGQVVTSLKASSATIAVAPGLYLVKVGNKTAKIAVK